VKARTTEVKKLGIAKVRKGIETVKTPVLNPKNRQHFLHQSGCLTVCRF